MFKSGFVLSTEAHLDAAIFNKSDVIVWLQGRIVDYGGKIETYTENSVTINGEKYMKANCEFKIRKVAFFFEFFLEVCRFRHRLKYSNH